MTEEQAERLIEVLQKISGHLKYAGESPVTPGQMKLFFFDLLEKLEEIRMEIP